MAAPPWALFISASLMMFLIQLASVSILGNTMSSWAMLGTLRTISHFSFFGHIRMASGICRCSPAAARLPLGCRTAADAVWSAAVWGSSVVALGELPGAGTVTSVLLWFAKAKRGAIRSL
jgi:hypothetical protein